MLAAVVWSLSGSLVWAQPDSPRPRGGGPRISLAELAIQKPVHEELKLSSDEVDRLKKVAEEGQAARRELRDLSEEDRRKKMREASEAGEKKVSEIITPPQFSRLKQIRYQVLSPWVFGNPQVVSALNLTDEEKEKIETITRETGESMRGLFQGGADFDKARQEAVKLRDVAQEKIMALLTSEQQTKWKEMTGEPFKGEIEMPGRGPGGRNRN
jgi:Spy/CpxP family protein refolding chaperone